MHDAAVTRATGRANSQCAGSRFGKARWRSRLKDILMRAATLVVMGFLLGMLQGWVAGGTYKSDRPAGAFTGFLHGMLMPAALPGLLLGRHVPIYAPNNSGNSYEIGFIAGINICGLLFFGTAFRGQKK